MAKSVSVIGLGYIGLPTAIALASANVRVHGVDINPQVVAALNRGETHLEEPGVAIRLKECVGDRLFSASTQVIASDYYIIAVPTPFEGDHIPDLSYVASAALAIAPHLYNGAVIILESTSPVGTTRQLCQWIQEVRPDLHFAHLQDKGPRVEVAYCPERVLPGRIMQELIENDRIIGGVTPESAEAALALYRHFAQGKIHLTSDRVAEMVKLAENTFRDVNIAYANELSMICEENGLDVWEVIALANRHPRVNILQPGPGVGGHCIAVDPWFIVHQAPLQAKLIRQARLTNLAKTDFVLAAIEKLYCQQNQPLALLGLAFKANVDDLRESPAVEITRALAQKIPQMIYVAEPHVSELPPALNLPNLQLVSLETAIEKAGMLVLLVDHKEFLTIDPHILSEKIIYDTRGGWR